MDKEALKQLKQVFYSQNFFTRYIDYLANRDFNNLSLGQNKALDVALTDSKGKRYYGKFFAKNTYLANKGIYSKHSINISERQAWASVEEFLDIIDNEAVDELNDLSNYLIDLFKYIQSDYPKNSAETKQKSEDTIIRLIVKHFWRENPLRYIERDFKTPIYCPDNGKIVILEENNAKQKVQNLIKDEEVKNATDVNGNLFIIRPFEHAPEILDRATFDVLIKTTEERLIDESLDDNFRQVIKYLQAVKKIRNNQAHNIGNTVEQGASSVFEFCLFVYLHLVLTLRQSLIRRGGEEYRSDNHAEFFVEIEKPSPSLTIKLFRLDDNDEVEIKPVVKEVRKLVFNVDYYVKYKLIVNDKREIETEFIYNSFTPHTTIHDLGDPIIYHGDEDSTLDKPVLFRGLLNKMENLEKKYEENTDALKETTKALDRNTTATEKAAEAAGRAAKAAENVGKKLVIIGETISNRFDKQREAEEEERERRKKDEEIRRQKEEEEKKAIEKKKRSRLYLFGGCVTALLIASVGVFIWCLIDDNSLLWLQHKTSLLFITSFTVLAFVLAVYKWYKSSNNQNSKKLAFSIGVTLLFVLFIGGSYFKIPHKNARDFVEKYDFSTHSDSHNLNAVAYIEKIREKYPKDELVLTKLASYYLYYAKDKERAYEIAKSMWNTKDYPKGCVILAETMFAKGLYKQIDELIRRHTAHNMCLPIPLKRLRGYIRSFNKVKGKYSRASGIKDLLSAAEEGDNPSCYCLGYLYSHQGFDCDFPKAVYWYRKAALDFPQAALELGSLYADVGIIDSAKYYYGKALLAKTNQEIRNEATFKLGLLLEQEGKEDNEYLQLARLEYKYPQARLHHALHFDNPEEAIQYYKEDTLTYSGYCYIPPIVFQYLKIGDFNSALSELNRKHPEGLFDNNFIKGMSLLIDYPKGCRDSILAMSYLEKSADEGCLYAKMICCYKNIEKDINRNWHLISQLDELGKTISFAYVLKAFLYNLKGVYYKDVEYAQMAIDKGNPAGAVVLSSFPPIRSHYVPKSHKEEGNEILLWADVNNKYSLWQKTVRIIPDKRNTLIMALNMAEIQNQIWEREMNNNNTKPQEIESFKQFYNQFEYPFWVEAVIKNHCADQMILFLTYYQYKYDRETIKKLINAAFRDMTPKTPKRNLVFLSFIFNHLSQDEAKEIDKEYKDNEFAQEVFHSEKYQKYREYSRHSYSDAIDDIGHQSIGRIDDIHLFNEFEDYLSFYVYESINEKCLLSIY